MVLAYASKAFISAEVFPVMMSHPSKHLSWLLRSKARQRFIRTRSRISHSETFCVNDREKKVTVQAVVSDNDRIGTLQKARRRVFEPFRKSDAEIGLQGLLDMDHLLLFKALLELKSSIRAIEQELGWRSPEGS